MNIPNLLTVLRVILIPLLVIFLMEGKMTYALLVFSCAAVSDGLDGLIARVFHQKTRIGAYLDPIADKLLIGSSYITLAILGKMPGWLTVLVMSRDLIILIGIGILLLNDKEIVIRPRIDSKLTTLVQLITVVSLLAMELVPRLTDLFPWFVGVTAGLTIFSGFHYLGLGLRMLNNGTNGAAT